MSDKKNEESECEYTSCPLNKPINYFEESMIPVKTIIKLQEYGELIPRDTHLKEINELIDGFVKKLTGLKRLEIDIDMEWVVRDSSIKELIEEYKGMVLK